MLEGTEGELAKQIAELMATSPGEKDREAEVASLTERWTKIFKKLFPHLVEKIKVKGIAPSGGGEITEGVIE